MDKTARRILGTFRVMMLATLALLHADPTQSETGRNATSDDRADKNASRPNDARYLQELAWKVYQREIKHSKPAKADPA
jgi:hypothetical protein